MPIKCEMINDVGYMINIPGRY